MFARFYTNVTNYLWPQEFSLEVSFHYSWDDEGKHKYQYRNCIPCESIDYLEKMYQVVYEGVKYIEGMTYFIQVKGSWRGSHVNEVFTDIKQYNDFLERVIATTVLSEFRFIRSGSRSGVFTMAQQDILLQKTEDVTFCSQIHGFYQRHFTNNVSHVITSAMSEKLLSLIKREIPELAGNDEHLLNKIRLD